MKRQQRACYEGNRYPDIDAAIGRRDLIKMMAAGVLASSIVPIGCFATPGEDDDMADDDVDGLWMVRLPSSDYRTLYFVPQGYIGYHLEVHVANIGLATYLEDNALTLMDVIDAVLGTHGVTEFEFATEEARIPYETEIGQALADAYEAGTGHITGDIDRVSLFIDDYDPEEDIPGDSEA